MSRRILVIDLNLKTTRAEFESVEQDTCRVNQNDVREEASTTLLLKKENEKEKKKIMIEDLSGRWIRRNRGRYYTYSVSFRNSDYRHEAANLFFSSATRSRRKHRANHGCAERLPKRSQITMECRQTGVPVRGTRWHTERSNDPCTVQRLRKEITPLGEIEWTTSSFVSTTKASYSPVT